MSKPKSPRWTNSSVLHFAGDLDPVEAITDRALEIVTHALDKGWTGPPFDPLALADLLDIKAVGSHDVPDARTVPGEQGEPIIEYNPTRPRGRMRYSLAHEIAHTLFDDWSDRVRNRAQHQHKGSDEWQLEALCNIAAAEFVMPLGSFRELATAELSIDTVIRGQKRFDVSMEAILIRTVHLWHDACAMFCVSPFGHGDQPRPYRVDYLIGSRTWKPDLISRGTVLPEETCAADCIAIGFSAKGTEQWGDHLFQVECLGIPPYPGSRIPRVVGLLIPSDGDEREEAPCIEYVLGDATKPRGEDERLLIHIVNDEAQIWGGGGFAAALRRAWPEAQKAYKDWVVAEGKPRLGDVHFAQVSDNLTIASLVAQKGYGESVRPRIRYQALLEGLRSVAETARPIDESAHMPRIGCGLAGGDWDLVEELIGDTLVSAGVPVTVYDLPNSPQRPSKVKNLSLF